MSFLHKEQEYYCSQDQYSGWNNTVNPAMGLNNPKYDLFRSPEVGEKVEVIDYQRFGGRARENVKIVEERVEVGGGRFFQPRQENIEVYKYQNYQNY